MPIPPFPAGGRTARQPRCGGCYFFQDAGFAGNGWCLHRNRQPPQGNIRVLVRRRELACMNDWGQTMFQPAEQPDPAGLLTLESPSPTPPMAEFAGDYLVEEATVWPGLRTQPANPAFGLFPTLNPPQTPSEVRHEDDR